MNKNKKILDDLLEKYKAEPVGWGYIDIIVTRNYIKLFVESIVNNNFIIESVSWWEYCMVNKKSKYGMGCPKSRYFEGRFCEIAGETDDIDYSNTMDNKESKIQKILNVVESKILVLPDEIIHFKTIDNLLPGFWLDVPDDWRNIYG